MQQSHQNHSPERLYPQKRDQIHTPGQLSFNPDCDMQMGHILQAGGQDKTLGEPQEKKIPVSIMNQCSNQQSMDSANSEKSFHNNHLLPPHNVLNYAPLTQCISERLSAQRKGQHSSPLNQEQMLQFRSVQHHLQQSQHHQHLTQNQQSLPENNHQKSLTHLSTQPRQHQMFQQQHDQLMQQAVQVKQQPSYQSQLQQLLHTDHKVLQDKGILILQQHQSQLINQQYQHQSMIKYDHNPQFNCKKTPQLQQPAAQHLHYLQNQFQQQEVPQFHKYSQHNKNEQFQLNESAMKIIQNTDKMNVEKTQIWGHCIQDGTLQHHLISNQETVPLLRSPVCALISNSHTVSQQHNNKSTLKQALPASKLLNNVTQYSEIGQNLLPLASFQFQPQTALTINSSMIHEPVAELPLQNTRTLHIVPKVLLSASNSQNLLHHCGQVNPDQTTRQTTLNQPTSLFTVVNVPTSVPFSIASSPAVLNLETSDSLQREAFSDKQLCQSLVNSLQADQATPRNECKTPSKLRTNGFDELQRHGSETSVGRNSVHNTSSCFRAEEDTCTTKVTSQTISSSALTELSNCPQDLQPVPQESTNILATQTSLLGSLSLTVSENCSVAEISADSFSPPPLAVRSPSSILDKSGRQEVIVQDLTISASALGPTFIDSEASLSGESALDESHMISTKPAICSFSVFNSKSSSPPSLAKRKLAEDEEGIAVCKHCGSTSTDLDRCESCNRIFPPDVKLIIKKKKKVSVCIENQINSERTWGGGNVTSAPVTGNIESTPKATMEKNIFYGKKLQSQYFGAKNQELTTEFKIKNRQSGLIGRRISHGGQTRKSVGRGKKTKEIEMVMILSSDEEEPTDSSQVPLDISVPTDSSQVPLDISVQEDDDIFDCISIKPSSHFGISRRQRMEDASGQCVNKTSPALLPLTADGAFFHVRGVRVGSMRTAGSEVKFMNRSIHFKIIRETTHVEQDFYVYITDLTHIHYSLHKNHQPLVFLRTTSACGNRIRCLFEMTEGAPEFYDPGSANPHKNMIVIIIEELTDEEGFHNQLDYYREHMNFLVITEMSPEDANDLLVQSSPPVLSGMQSTRVTSHSHISSVPLDYQSPSAMGGDSFHLLEEHEEHAAEIHMVGDMACQDNLQVYDENSIFNSKTTPEEVVASSSRTPSPFRPVFEGPIEKILIYPFQTKGAITITNQDMFCLNDEEFLNDGIIDFFLKYLHIECLRDEDRERTHIMSSFFYKRLMQRDKNLVRCDPEKPKITIAEKRHARVKKWTKDVDIFSKDFVVIPINEHSHWFLAIVCYPGLLHPEFVTYIPAPVLPCASKSSSAVVDSKYGRNFDGGDSPVVKSEGEPNDFVKDVLHDATVKSGSKSRNSKTVSVFGKIIQTTDGDSNNEGVIIGIKQSCILIMDSLMNTPRRQCITAIKEYLSEEWKAKRSEERDFSKVRGCFPKVPQQNNYHDCGLYLLQYVESFFENPIANFTIPMNLERWFNPEEKVVPKRKEIVDLIKSLSERLGSRQKTN